MYVNIFFRLNALLVLFTPCTQSSQHYYSVRRIIAHITLDKSDSYTPRSVHPLFDRFRNELLARCAMTRRA